MANQSRDNGVHSGRRAKLLAGVAIMAACAALSACGSSSSTSSTPAGSTSAAKAQPTATPVASSTKGKTIVIGTICGCSGAFASANGSIPPLVAAWQKWTNANGGIDGYPVKVILIDDGDNATVALQAAKQLVQQDHVVAIAGEFSQFDETFAPYLKSVGVPAVGGITFTGPMGTNSDFYPSGGAFAPVIYGMLQGLKAAGKTKFGVFTCTESPVCAGIPTLFEGAARTLGGLTDVYNGKVSASEPSYAAPCLAAKAAGVQAVFTAEGSAIAVRVAQQCQQQGFTPIQMSSGGAVSQLWTTSSVMNGAVISQYNLPFSDTSTTAGQQFHAVISKYAPSIEQADSYGENLPPVFAGLQLFRAAAEAAHITPTSTAADVKKGLYLLKNETLGGAAPPLSYKPGVAASFNCYFSERLQDGKFVIGNDAKASCLTPAQDQALTKAIS
jgi:branched-chain amino acid transport system substrate-binding protein